MKLLLYVMLALAIQLVSVIYPITLIFGNLWHVWPVVQHFHVKYVRFVHILQLRRDQCEFQSYERDIKIIRKSPCVNQLMETESTGAEFR